MAKKATDHKPFLEAVEALRKRVGKEKKFLTVGLSDTEAHAIIAHGKWLKKFIASRKAASAARTSFGPKRKPDGEVTPNALAMRKWREENK